MAVLDHRSQPLSIAVRRGRAQGAGGMLEKISFVNMRARARFLSLTCIISGLGEVARSWVRMLSFQWVARQVFGLRGKRV